MRVIALLLALATTIGAADQWLRHVAPIIRPEERQRYRELPDESAREAFQQAFWTGRPVSAEEYARRLTYADQAYGSAANTDCGRVSLSLGEPARITRLASSRTFYPIEIWHYASAPSLGVRSAVQFLFFQPRNSGFYRLFVPQRHTIRALLVPQTATLGAFPVNEIVTARDLRQRLNLSPAEDEVIDAVLGVARGITGSGNTEILARAVSPAEVLRSSLTPVVTSRLLAGPDVSTSRWWMEDGIPVVDVVVRTNARSGIAVAAEQDGVVVSQASTALAFDEPRAVSHEERLFLLPGRYTLRVTVDGTTTPHALTVFPRPAGSNVAAVSHEGDKPWLSIGRQFLLRGQTDAAWRALQKAWGAAPTRETAVLLAQCELRQGQLDAARDRLQAVLKDHPDDVEALVAMGSVLAEFQDYTVSASYYRRALHLRRTPVVERALAAVVARVDVK